MSPNVDEVYFEMGTHSHRVVIKEFNLCIK